MFACCNSLSSNLKTDLIFLYVWILLLPPWTCIQYLSSCAHAVCFFVQVRKRSTSLLLCGCCLHLPEHVDEFSIFPKVYMLCFLRHVWMQYTSLFVWMQVTFLCCDGCIEHSCPRVSAALSHMNVGNQSIFHWLFSCCQLLSFQSDGFNIVPNVCTLYVSSFMHGSIHHRSLSVDVVTSSLCTSLCIQHLSLCVNVVSFFGQAWKQ